MDDFWNDVRELAASPVSSQAEAQSVIDLFGELIAQEIPALDSEACQRCCSAMVYSKAYQSDLQQSHDRLRSMLLTTDPLHKHEVEFVGTVILSDTQFMQSLGNHTAAINAVISYIWMFRFTQPRIVEKYMLILVATCIATRLDPRVLQETITSSFVLYLFRTVCENDEFLTRPSLLVLLALNHQYMLEDMHGPANKVFWELEQSPQKYSDLGGALVMRLNRSHDSDEALKVITCKFLYLLFSAKQTADLLYTNDLNVLLGVVIRELNDLPTESVQTREMFLRVLYVMLVHSSLRHSSPHVRSTIVQTLRLIMERVLELDAKSDQAEMMRLAERCLSVKWLKWGNDDASDEGAESDASNTSDISDSDSSSHSSRRSSFVEEVEPRSLIPEPESPSTAQPIRPDSPRVMYSALDVKLPQQQFASKFAHSRPPPPPPPPAHRTPPRMRVPPPPPPPPRHMSVESIASEDSQLSLDFVEQLRPPPPAPPSRKSLRLEKVRSTD